VLCSSGVGWWSREGEWDGEGGEGEARDGVTKTEDKMPVYMGEMP